MTSLDVQCYPFDMANPLNCLSNIGLATIQQRWAHMLVLSMPSRYTQVEDVSSDKRQTELNRSEIYYNKISFVLAIEMKIAPLKRGTKVEQVVQYYTS